MALAPTLCATYTTSGVKVPSDRGGDARMMFLHPATLAGIPSIIAVDGSTAVPPGTYRPTDSMARENREQMTPGAVST
ncbi:hypothetical protein AWJ20_2550 [Sugiyamaella lignohabitans]|uniref:Uncharacterized protein n=1 Tax=Sugiyamaella lignohabitans TaxID=796027 RepID=A0A167F810_9ASCO|nr:uncharacterized protein AWJ20_2550 [Sugiyamaella lignohabitans]ANB14933.1 hypothetical protein AWJ20_2550 [Sugiyamaella lignohabitans]